MTNGYLISKIFTKHIVTILLRTCMNYFFGTMCAHIKALDCVSTIEIRKIQLILLLILPCYRICSLVMYVFISISHLVIYAAILI